MSHTYQNSSLRNSRLDYLNLCQEPAHVEIGMTASFNFETLKGALCTLPAANPLIRLSHTTASALERACVQRINDIFIKEYLPALGERLFGWSSVDLPLSMKKRLHLDESISAGRTSTRSPFFFPDPLIHSTPTLLPRRELFVDDTSFSGRLSAANSSLISDISDISSTNSKLLASPLTDESFRSSVCSMDDRQSLSLSLASDHLESSFIIPSLQNVTLRDRRREETPSSPTFGLLADGIAVTRSGRMSGPLQRTGKFTLPLPNISGDESDHSPISISSGSTPGTPVIHNSTLTPESPTTDKPPCRTGQAPVSVTAQTNRLPKTLPLNPSALVLGVEPAPQSRASKDKVPSKLHTADDVRAMALMLPRPVLVSTAPSVDLAKKTPRTAKRKPIEVITMDDVEAAKARSVPRVKKIRSFVMDPQTPGPDSSISRQNSSPKPRKPVTRTPKHTHSGSTSSVLPHAGNMQVQTSLHNQEDGLAVTNNFYLMTMDPFAAAHNQTRDIGHDRITAEINKVLGGYRVSSTTLDEIWMGIYQAPGYEPHCWMSNLAKNDVPEELFGPILQIMRTASTDRRKTQW